MSAKLKAAIKLNDASLFGNDAAEDEIESVFHSYFVDRPEITRFLDPNSQFLVLRAYRGEGKSAILRHAAHTLTKQEILTVRSTGGSLSPDISSEDPGAWTKGWKRQILGLLAAEIGSRIGMAWSDDSISLVEEAERNGFKSRSLVSSIVDRLTFSALPQKKAAAPIGDPEKVLQRWMQGRLEVWVFVDDVDENFVNTAQARAKVSSFFGACRDITNLIPEIRIRSGIRPNIWQIIRSDAESLGKVNQYCVDIRWDTPMLRAILARRVEAYLLRTDQQHVLDSIANLTGEYGDELLIALAFEKEMEWGFNSDTGRPRSRPPHVVMSTLSKHRPRWMIELAKLAATKAHELRVNQIGKSHIFDVLEGFGRTRIDDLSAEYRCECPQIREIINAFADGQEDFSTAELQTLIEKRITSHLDLTFASSGRSRQPLKIAAFLYEIGFLTARETLPSKEYRHYTFAEKPELLHNRTNLDRGMSWEIHPVFRQALGLRTSSGRKKDTRNRK